MWQTTPGACGAGLPRPRGALTRWEQARQRLREEALLTREDAAQPIHAFEREAAAAHDAGERLFRHQHG